MKENDVAPASPHTLDCLLRNISTNDIVGALRRRGVLANTWTVEHLRPFLQDVNPAAAGLAAASVDELPSVMVNHALDTVLARIEMRCLRSAVEQAGVAMMSTLPIARMIEEQLAQESREQKGDVVDGDREVDWDDLRGRAPGATGALSSEAFVRELRDDWT